MSAVALDTSRSVAEPSAIGRRIAAAAVVLYAVVTLIPLVWIFLTGFKTPPDSIAYPPKVVFDPSLEGYVNVFTTRTRQTPDYLQSLPPVRHEVPLGFLGSGGINGNRHACGGRVVRAPDRAIYQCIVLGRLLVLGLW